MDKNECKLLEMKFQEIYFDFNNCISIIIIVKKQEICFECNKYFGNFFIVECLVMVVEIKYLVLNFLFM